MSIIDEFENIREKHCIEQITILYNMSCHENYKKLTNTEKEIILGFLYILYLKDESKTDSAVFSNFVMDNYRKVLNKEITRENIYNFL